MNEFFVWPRMNSDIAHAKMHELGPESGPRVDLDILKYDFSPVGRRVDAKKLEVVRDAVIAIANEYGFRRRHGFEQSAVLSSSQAKLFDIELTKKFLDVTPMRWSEAGHSEVWNWFALALLPDVTHWRWRSSALRNQDQGTDLWYKSRWIGNDLSRHTWARLWWRRVQFSYSPESLYKLQEHDLNHLLERADTIGANQRLLAGFAEQLIDLANFYKGHKEVNRRQIFDDSARRMLRFMAYIDDAALNEDEMGVFVEDFMRSTKILINDTVADTDPRDPLPEQPHNFTSSVPSPKWSLDEITLVAELGLMRAWESISSQDAQVQELSSFLQTHSPERIDNVVASFRNTSGVVRKYSDLKTHLPGYGGKPTKGSENDAIIIQTIVSDPASIFERADSIRNHWAAS